MGDDERDLIAAAKRPTLSAGVRGRLDAATGIDPGLVPGARIRHYELIRKVGEGGMGVVFLARDLKLGRRVAMKFVTTRSLDASHRFVAEARLTASCQHENIVVIHEVDAHHGTPYMVLEYVEGKTLRADLGRTILSPGRAIELVLPVIRAVACAHENGIVHRDLKMANVLLGANGVVKVLDFGIAKVLTEHSGPRINPTSLTDPLIDDPASDEPTVQFPEGSPSGTQQGAQVGTPAYMAPEQFNGAPIDHRADLWAIGIMLFRMVTGRHPLSNPTTSALILSAGDLDTPHDSVGLHTANLPAPLVQIIDRCLEKRVERRWPDARSLLAALEPLLHARIGRALDVGECPFPGLSAFQESDADRFFGRHRDTLRAVTRLRERPLVTVIGPSGVGKSSFIRAGVVPALKATGDTWTTITMRPGRTPIATLAAQLRALAPTPADLERRLRSEPGLLGSLLRELARTNGGKVLLFVDQFEELYTLVEPDERKVVTAALAGVADDVDTPVRVMLSLRSDFIDRVDEDRRFSDEMLRGILVLSPPNRDDLREALTQPLAQVGHSFEDNGIVDEMVATLDATAGALPLLQFTAARLWEVRDRAGRKLTRAGYRDLGGVAGALATHADDVVSRLAPPQQRIAQMVFQRLVTPERTRRIVESRELDQLSRDPRDVQQLLDYLAAERLLVVQTRGTEDGSTVEIVHESLVTSWPTLRRWLDESSGEMAFLARLSSAAKQWHEQAQNPGLLWRGDAAEDARRWRRRSELALAAREHAYLHAVLALADRSMLVRRRLVIATISVLATLVAAAAIALISIRRAERRAADQATVARSEAQRALAAEAKVVEQLELVHAKERERATAVSVAAEATVVVAGTKEELKVANTKLVQALKVAEAKSAVAAAESEKALAAAKKLEVLLAKEKARTRELEIERARITEKLR